MKQPQPLQWQQYYLVDMLSADSNMIMKQYFIKVTKPDIKPLPEKSLCQWPNCLQLVQPYEYDSSAIAAPTQIKKRPDSSNGRKP